MSGTADGTYCPVLRCAMAQPGDQRTSNIVTAAPVAPLTVAPANLKVTAIRTNQVHLVWNSVPGAAYYRVQYRLEDQPYQASVPWALYGTPDQDKIPTTEAGICTSDLPST